MRQLSCNACINRGLKPAHSSHQPLVDYCNKYSNIYTGQPVATQRFLLYCDPLSGQHRLLQKSRSPVWRSLWLSLQLQLGLRLPLSYATAIAAIIPVSDAPAIAAIIQACDTLLPRLQSRHIVVKSFSQPQCGFTPVAVYCSLR